MNEWGFAAEVKSWWDSEFPRHPQWGLNRCEVEEQVELGGSIKRSDLTVHGSGVVRLAGELRLPDHPQASPWHPENLLNAINKATTHGTRWAFSSDGVTLLLVDANLAGPPQARVVQRLDLVPFGSRDQLDDENFLVSVKQGWIDALGQIVPVLLGLAAPAGMSPDEVFIESLRALLRSPVAAIRDELNRQRTQDGGFEQDLVTWMVDEQGWAHDPAEWNAEVQRAAILTAYVFTTRLMFYLALRRSQPSLGNMQMPDVDAAAVRPLFRTYFEQARERSGDYNTLFHWDRNCEYALCADSAVPGWRRVLDHLAVFDLSHIGYDVMGKMFERLIDPHERYRWGQHYTNPDVVDLMLSFGLPDGEGEVLDPATGGGTFLVRAYVRKRVRQPDATHQQRLSELYGFDVSAFAASVATVNLAVRDLEFADNYPRVAVRSFFRVEPRQVYMALPGPRGVSLDGAPEVEVAVDRVRAMVCNPPYVRLHEVGADRQAEAEAALARPGLRVAPPAVLHGLANYHVFFWLHGAQFLEPDGRLVMITSGEWMDSDYGVALQKWLLDNFCIELFIETIAETWFSEARVGTVVVVAQLCTEERRREDNLVRFVLLRKSLRDLYGQTTSDVEQIESVDRLRDRMLALNEPVGESDDFDWSLIRQQALRELGTTVGGA